MNTFSHNIHQGVIERCKSGERQAQYELYKLYAKAMYNTSLRITGNTAEAEDVLQEAFVNAFKNIHSYNGKATFGAWLKRIVINKSITAVNRRKVEFISLEGQGSLQEEADESEVLPESVAQVQGAIKELPEGYRIVLSLYLLEGYDHKEIAGILNISESTSKSQYNRAKKKLKETLTKGLLYEG